MDERPLGLWVAADVHRRAFGWRSGGRIVSAFTLLTPSWRVEHPHAVATLVARDAVSLLTWTILTVVAVGLLSVVLAFAMLGSIAAMVLVALALLTTIAVAAGLQQRVSAWRTASGRREALMVSNLAADPRGCGHGAALMAAVVGFADAVGRELVLRVDPMNDPAVRLYRKCGFAPGGAATGGRVRMVRPCSASAPRAAPPSWLVPICCGAPTAIVAAAVGGALVGLYWGTPAAWLMVPVAGIGALAAENDLRTLRIPNRLVAIGASVIALAVAVVAAAFDPAIVWPAVIGAAIFAVPLFVNHVASPSRSGLGDVKLAAILGLVAGAVHPAAAVGALLVSMLLGSAFGAFWRRAHHETAGFPLAPALAVGTSVVLALWAVLEGPTTW